MLRRVGERRKLWVIARIARMRTYRGRSWPSPGMDVSSALRCATLRHKSLRSLKASTFVRLLSPSEARTPPRSPKSVAPKPHAPWRRVNLAARRVEDPWTRVNHALRRVGYLLALQKMFPRGVSDPTPPPPG